MSGIKEDYKWLSRIIDSNKNRSRHQTALHTLIHLFKDKWESTHGDTFLFKLAMIKFNDYLYGESQ